MALVLVPPPDPLEIREVFLRYFLNRTDYCPVVIPKDRPDAPDPKPRPIACEKNLTDLIAGHVEGELAPPAKVQYTRRDGSVVARLVRGARIGAYAPGLDSTTKWTCVDIDGSGHSAPVADPEAAALRIWFAFREAGLPAVLERSGGGKGYHVWIFWEQPVHAEVAKAIGHLLMPQDIPLAKSGPDGSVAYADAKSARGLEVFPKQTGLRRDGFGNLVFLPWWHGAAEGGNQFYLPEGEAWRGIELASIDRAQSIIASAPPDKQKTTHGAKLSPLAKRNTVDTGDEDQDPILDDAYTTAPTYFPPELWRAAWREANKQWRKRALDAFDIECIYGEWTTGRYKGAGWLECRDPLSPSGDRDPSASVSDGTGEAQRGKFHSFRDGRTLSVFEFIIERGWANDMPSAMDYFAGKVGVPRPTNPEVEKIARELESAAPPSAFAEKPSSTGAHSEDNDQRPIIETNNRQLDAILRDAWRITLADQDQHARVFRRSGILVRLARNDSGIPLLKTMTKDAVFGYLFRVARWMKMTDEGRKNVKPIADIARDFYEFPHPDLPILEAVTLTPVYDDRGRLVSSPGYDKMARIFSHQLPGFSMQPVPQSPTDEQVKAALDLIYGEALEGFPFVSQADKANALAALLTPLVRRMIEGCTPIFLIQAPSPGSGKGLFADLLMTITVASTMKTTMPSNEDEMRKQITTLLLEGWPIICIDNVNGIDSPVLAAAITGEVWHDRKLGGNESAVLNNRAVWLATGNNPSLSHEIIRRTVSIRIDPRTDRPELRRNFKHPKLLNWARHNRGRLVHALLTCVQRWISLGKPEHRGIRLGSFGEWSDVLGGILESIGVPGFLGNLEEVRSTTNSGEGELGEFVQAWRQAFGSNPTHVGDLISLADSQNLMAETLGDVSARSQAIKLGKLLNQIRDRQFGSLRVEFAGRQHNQTTWRVVVANGQGGHPKSTGSAAGAAPSSVPPESGASGAVPDLSEFDDLYQQA